MNIVRFNASHIMHTNICPLDIFHICIIKINLFYMVFHLNIHNMELYTGSFLKLSSDIANDNL